MPMIIAFFLILLLARMWGLPTAVIMMSDSLVSFSGFGVLESISIGFRLSFRRWS